jgi:hypothetical protein
MKYKIYSDLEKKDRSEVLCILKRVNLWTYSTPVLDRVINLLRFLASCVTIRSDVFIYVKKNLD